MVLVKFYTFPSPTLHTMLFKKVLVTFAIFLPKRSTFNILQRAMTSEDEWKMKLNKEQFRILREKGTEPANSGIYNKHYESGVYHCAGCNAPLYTSKHKFDSGCGWPAFFDALPGAITVM